MPHFASRNTQHPLKPPPFPHFFLKILAHPNKCLTFAAPEPAKPLNDAQMSGSFFYMHMTERIPFGKHYTEEQTLFAEYPEVDLRALGFPSGNWQDEPLWSTR